MMIGTADEIVKAPEKGPVFVEDLQEEEQVVALVRLTSQFMLISTIIKEASSYGGGEFANPLLVYYYGIFHA
jgi:hypothetical protein